MPEMTEFRVILAVSFPKHIHVFLFLQYFGDLEGFTIYVICSAFVFKYIILRFQFQGSMVFIYNLFDISDPDSVML